MNDFLPVYSGDQIRAAEEIAFAVTAPGELMQRASFALGVGCADLLLETYDRIYGTTVVVVAGPGNNGGDSLYAGALLAKRGVKVLVHCVVTDRFHVEGMAALLSAGGVITEIDESLECDLVIDGISGIGSSRAVDPDLAKWINTQPLVVAVDIPSGVNADTGECDHATCIHADVTFTFGALKPGLVLTPGAEFAGEIEVVDIGIFDSALSRDEQPVAEIIDEPAALKLFGDTEFDSYKYSRGVVGIAAGSARYPGAAQLCVLGAQYTGVGMVIFREVDGFESGITGEFPNVVVGESDRIASWGAGPGFTGSAAEHEFLTSILSSELPVVVDAGALTMVARSAELRDVIYRRTATTVLTPHAGEFRALFPDLGEISKESVVAAATSISAIVVGKGPRTVIGSPDSRCFIDIEGTAALATAGSGDVLTGNIAGLLASHRDADPLSVVALGVWMHGRAGRIAALDIAQPTAVDLGLACAEVFAE